MYLNWSLALLSNYPTSKILHFSIQNIYDSEEKFANTYLLDQVFGDQVRWPVNLIYCCLIMKWVVTWLTHWGRMTHICVGKLTIIGSDNGLSPGRRQAIIWTNAWILLIWPLGTNFNEILIGNQTFSFKKMHLKMSSAKWRPFCLSLNVLNDWISVASVTSRS